MSVADVCDLMASSRSEKEWNSNCSKVKAEFGGTYPEFWFKEVIQSGLLSRTQLKW